MDAFRKKWMQSQMHDEGNIAFADGNPGLGPEGGPPAKAAQSQPKMAPAVYQGPQPARYREMAKPYQGPPPVRYRQQPEPYTNPLLAMLGGR